MAAFHLSLSISVDLCKVGIWPAREEEGTGAKMATSYMAVLREASGLGTGNSTKNITDRRKWIFKEMKCVNASVCVCVWMMRYKGCKEEREREHRKRITFFKWVIQWRIVWKSAKTSYGWKEREREEREKKQMEELKSGRNGSFAQVGWMDGWLGGRWKISLSFILPLSSNDVAADLQCLSSSGQSPHTDAQCQIKSYPVFICPRVHPVFS